MSQYFWISSVDSSFYWKSNDSSNAGACISNIQVAPLCFLTQFSLLGAEMWFCVLSRDIHLTITNPFTSYKLQSVRYSIFVFTWALGTASVLMIIGNKQEGYGLSSDAIIWIRDQVAENVGTTEINFSKIFLFYFWMSIIYTYSLYVLIFATQRIRRGLQSTLQARLETVKRASACKQRPTPHFRAPHLPAPRNG